MNQFFSFVLKYITVISLKKWNCALKINYIQILTKSTKTDNNPEAV